MLQITVPPEDLPEFGKSLGLLSKIKGCKITTVHEWNIPCASGVRLSIKLEGPPGTQAQAGYFDQAIRLLEVARDGAKGWGDTETKETD